MDRFAQSEHARRFREADRMDPVENAFRAICALSDADRAKVARRFNSAFDRCLPKKQMHFMSIGIDLARE